MNKYSLLYINWIEDFCDKLYEHHGFDYFKENKNLPFQLAVAYFDWADDMEPEETVDEAFKRYLEAEK